jgi:2-(1,2-epoxy-1,2-dihydrophenyl)acetyl-CoA isomerase
VDDIVISSADGVGTVRINRPDRGNSVTPDVVTRLAAAVSDLVDSDTISAVVLTGTGSVFCAGADVKDMFEIYSADGPDALMDYLGLTWMPAVQRTVRTLWSARKPLIAAYNGAATAGGLDFGLSCDVRLSARSARFAESYVNLGMVPVAGGAYLLPSLVGLSTATRMLASGAFIDADEALRTGMVAEVCDDDRLLDRVHEVALEMSQGPSATFARAKQVARAAATVELEAALQESLAANIQLIALPEVRGRILAVMERYSLARARHV